VVLYICHNVYMMKHCTEMSDDTIHVPRACNVQMEMFSSSGCCVG